MPDRNKLHFKFCSVEFQQNSYHENKVNNLFLTFQFVERSFHAEKPRFFQEKREDHLARCEWSFHDGAECDSGPQRGWKNKSPGLVGKKT